MPTDPLTAWLIALVVTTLYGWYMNARGKTSGRNEASKVIADALEFKGVMLPATLLGHVEDYYVYVEEMEGDEE